jgi:phage terminase small subunit
MRAKTKEEKELTGTYQACRDKEDAIELAKYDINPMSPKIWPLHIQKLWSDRCKDMKNTGYLARAFMPLLRRYCFAVYQAEEAEKHLLDEGFVTLEKGTMGQEYEVVSKWVYVLDNATKTIERISSKLGFSPLDMQKIPAVQKKEGAEMSLLK